MTGPSHLAVFGLRFIAAVALISTPLQAAADMLPANWDGLVQVKSKKLEFVYLLPNADFRPYSKIEYDPVQISMRKNWLRDYNTSSVGEGSVIRDSDVRDMLTKASGEFDKYFAQEFTNAGYAIVTAPAADVLRVSVEVLNVDVSAPDTSVGIQRTFTADAGQAALLIEVRDSVSNQLLGRAVDRKLAGDEGPMMRTSASNWGDFESMFRNWAKTSAQGLTELKSLSPVDASGLQKR